MSGANSRQVGGDHYHAYEYIHWDFVFDAQLDYLLGCASKYVSRWRNKNGVQDLEKAMHYLEKAAEREIPPPIATPTVVQASIRFTKQLGHYEGLAVQAMVDGLYHLAIGYIISIRNDVLMDSVPVADDSKANGEQPRA